MVAMKILEQKQLLSKKVSKGLLSGDKLDQGFAKSYVENIIWTWKEKKFIHFKFFMRLYSHFVSKFYSK